MDAPRSGVYRAARAEEIIRSTQASGLSLAKIAFGEKAALLSNIAAALEFPAWFGHNWDALEDCLGDLSWRNARGHVLVIENARPGDEFGILVDVLRSSAESWAARGKPFLAVFVDPAGALALPELPAGK